MKEKSFGNITVRTDNQTLYQKIGQYADISEFTELNVNMVSIQLINMVSETEIVDSIADYMHSGTMTAQSVTPLISAGAASFTGQGSTNDGFEVLYVLSGSVTEIIDQVSHEVLTHDALLMNPHCRKVMHPNPQSTLVIITIAREFFQMHGIPRFFSEIFSSQNKSKDYYNSRYICFRKKEFGEEHYREVDAAIRMIYDELQNKRAGFDDIVNGMIKRLFSYLGSSDLYSMKKTSNRLYHPEQLVEQIKKYLDRNPRKVSTKELAEYFHYHRDYISRVFLQKMNQTIKQYNTTVYQKEAFRLLTQSDMPISKIAETLGFSSRSQFYNSFYNYYHTMPNEIRKKG